MGYTTSFSGKFILAPSLNHEQWLELTHLNDADPHAHVKEGAPEGYCQWILTREADAIVWDDGEKFYDYVEWLQWIIDKRLKPWGVAIAGEVTWQGESHGDAGVLSIVDGKVIASKLERAGKEVDEDELREALELTARDFTQRYRVTYR